MPPARAPRRRPAALAGLAVALGVVLSLALPAGPASAHAFLVRASPAPGARLAQAPDLVTLQFSEVLTSGGSGMTVTEVGRPGSRRLAVRLVGGGTAMEAPLPRLGGPGAGAGVYTVAWTAVSAVDGHLTSGAFSFGVGHFSGTLPSPSSHQPFPNLGEAAASWLVVAGAAGALGGLTAAGEALSPLVPVGLAVGLAGAGLQTVLTLSSPATSPPRLAYLALAAAVAFALGLVLVPRTRRRAPLALLGVAALAAWVGAGHGPAQAGRVGWATEAAHVVAVSAWAGSLVQLGWDVVRRGRAALPALRMHARLAPAAVLVVAGTGVALAYEVLPGPGAMVSSAYGRILVAKSALLAAALGLAAAVRLGMGSPGGRRPRGSGGRRPRAGVGGGRLVPAEAALVLAAVAGGALLTQVGPPAPGVAAEAVLGAPPLSGPVFRAGGLAGDLTVGVAVSSSRLEVEVYAGQAQLAGTNVHVSTGAPGGPLRDVGPLQGCGPGCFLTGFTPLRGARALAVDAAAPGWRAGRLTTRVYWPPPPQDAAGLARLVSTMRAVPRVNVVETVFTGGGQAPSASEQVSGAALLADEPWANGADYASSLPDGGPGLYLYLAGGPIWDRVTLDAAGRLAAEEIVSSGNRIERTFSYPG